MEVLILNMCQCASANIQYHSALVFIDPLLNYDAIVMHCNTLIQMNLNFHLLMKMFCSAVPLCSQQRTCEESAVQMRDSNVLVLMKTSLCPGCFTFKRIIFSVGRNVLQAFKWVSSAYSAHSTNQIHACWDELRF